MKRTVLVLVGLLLVVIMFALVFSLAQGTKPMDAGVQTQIMQTANAAAIGTAKANNP